MGAFTVVIATSFCGSACLCRTGTDAPLKKIRGAYRYDNDGSRICFVSSVTNYKQKANMIQRIAVNTRIFCRRMARARLNVNVVQVIRWLSLQGAVGCNPR